MFLSTKPLIFLSEICFQLEVAIRVIWPLSNWTVKEPEGWTLGGLARYPSEGRRTYPSRTYPSEGHRAGPQGRWPEPRSGSFHHWLMAYLRLWVEEVRDVTGGLAGTYSLTNTAGRAAGPHVTAFPLERTLLSDKDPPPPVTALLCRDLGHAPILPAFMRHTHTPICSYCTDHLRKVPQGLLTPVPWRGEHGWGQPPVRSFVSPGF